LPALTGLRGIAALWVVFFHLPATAEWPIVSQGYLGVGIFFILSGFILSHVYSTSFDRFRTSTYLLFLRQRIARIYPLHLVTLVMMGVLVLLLPHFADRYPHATSRFSASSFFACLFLVQDWAYWHPLSWNGPAWSLSAEWFLYLCFPFIATGLRPIRSGRCAVMMALAAIAGFIIVFKFKGVPDLGAVGMPSMLRATADFSAGCLLHKAFAAGVQIDRRAASVLSGALILIAALFDDLDWLAPFGFAALVLLAASGQGVVGVLLSARPMVFLGEISFSLYMFHWMIIQLVNWGMQWFGPDGWIYDLVEAVFTLIAIFAVAVVSYRYIEGPARAWVRRAERASRATCTKAVS
jgi:peptidoglycan/LPS O-acetylase OafA/YrhL